MNSISYYAYLSLLIGLAVIGYLASDMYLPAFVEMQDYFSSSTAAIGLSISVYMIGLSIGQLFYGPLSDSFGRKLPLQCGLILFLIGTLGCYLATSIELFLVSRVLQALGICAATVIWQPIVMDKFDAQTAHKLFGIIFPLLGLSPAIAPAIGGYITINFLWQSIFMALLILGALLFVGITLGYKETLEQSKKQKNNWANIFKQYKSLSLEPYFMGYIGCLSLASGIYFCYLTVSPFILENLGLTPEKIGLSYIPQTLGFMLGGFFSKKISDRIGTEKLIKYTLYTIVGAAILFAFSMPATSAWNLIIPFIFIATCNGILFPAVMNLILTKYKKISGLAAGFSGFVQGSTAFLATFFAAALTGQSSIKLGVIIVIIAFSSWLCHHLLITKKSIKKL